MSVKAGQLVLPVRVIVAVCPAAHYCTDCARRVNIGGLVQDIAAAVVGIDSCCAEGAARRVVDAGQLAKSVLLVGSRYTVASLAGDIASVIVGISEVHRVRAAALRDALHKRRGRVRAVGAAAGYVGVRGRISRSVGDNAACDPLTAEKGASP